MEGHHAVSSDNNDDNKPEGGSGEESNKGKLVLGVTCVSADITYLDNEHE